MFKKIHKYNRLITILAITALLWAWLAWLPASAAAPVEPAPDGKPYPYPAPLFLPLAHNDAPWVIPFLLPGFGE